MSPRWYLIQGSLINSRIIHGLPPVQWLLTWVSDPPQNYKLFFLPHRLNSFPPALVSSFLQLLGTLTYSTGLCCWWIFVAVALFPLLSSYGGGSNRWNPGFLAYTLGKCSTTDHFHGPAASLKHKFHVLPKSCTWFSSPIIHSGFPTLLQNPSPSGLGSKPSSLSWNHNC